MFAHRIVSFPFPFPFPCSLFLYIQPRGGEIEVCAENVEEYLELRLRYIMVERVSDQLAQFLLGVYDVVPLALLCVFTTHELELLMCGLPFIDVTDWRSHTLYRGTSNDGARAAAPLFDPSPPPPPSAERPSLSLPCGVVCASRLLPLHFVANALLTI